jgi:hypothetical protein
MPAVIISINLSLFAATNVQIGMRNVKTTQGIVHTLQLLLQALLNDQLVQMKLLHSTLGHMLLGGTYSR